MGIFFNKIVKPLFRSQKGNWISRLNELTDNQLKIARDAKNQNEKNADQLSFAYALDGITDLIENWEALLESIAEFYIKFDIITARPIHKIALKNPEKLSETEKLRFLDEVGILILNNIKRKHPLIPPNLCRMDSLGILMGLIGMVFYPEVRKKGYMLWMYLEDCFPLCQKFKYKTHLPKSFIELLERTELKS